ncbi:hypothetical protein GRI69_14220 [Erythrobacter vulgaris]|uniref:PAS domain-containing protein n=1 Tax=Qipengyuania vulgaris TaxID=291985 RepID=A0A844XVM9_9SPHN|nr:hypothetical protein [Qipengyuania vulgaris]MXO49409.1 hypothetical protein [Qipengyuania vulgaris]
MDRLGGEFGAFGAGRDFDDSDEGGYADDGAHSNPPPSPVGQDERRMQVRAYNHWSSLLGSESLPHIEDLEPEFLGDFGPYSVLLDFSTGSTTPTIQFMGKELSRECRLGDAIETLQEIPRDSLLSKIAENYLDVVSAQAPVSFEAESANAKGTTVAYRGILLPYSSDSDTIDFVYAVINWKEIADARTADALLEEIDRAMEFDAPAEGAALKNTSEATAEIGHFHAYDTAEESPEVAEDHIEENHLEAEDNILELRDAPAETGSFRELPVPSFGHDDNQSYSEDSGNYEAPKTPKRNRAVDALGNPLGGASENSDEDVSPAGITTAADYGLPDWDEEEPEAEDVDDLVNPLANIDLNSRLLALVNAGTRGKKTVDLGTLADTRPEDEEGAQEDSELFRPKAPSVDTLLSPEPYEEEDEAEFEAHHVDGEFADEAPVDYAYPSYTAADEVEDDHAPESFAEDTGTPSADVSDYEWNNQGAIEPDEPHTESENAYTYSYVDEEPAHILFGQSINIAEPDLTETASFQHREEALAEPLELGEEMIIEEWPGETEAEVDEGFAEAAEEEPTAESDYDEFEIAEAAFPEETYEEESVALVEAGGSEAQGAGDAWQTQDPESLTGLLAAVRDLTEAARTTEDLGRRALYEAVGRAFDVSIKAVIASERHPGTSHGVVEPFPIDALSENGPELALVMVRRKANGDTEVVGEVPHDSILMETATLKLASK